MPRRRRPLKRQILPDPKFGSELVSKFINCMMLDGKKGVSEQNFYKAMEIISTKTGKSPVEVFEQAMENVKPLVEVKSRRVGGATYQVPIEIRAERRQALAIRWIINYARARGEKTMFQKLAGEFMDAFQCARAQSVGSARQKETNKKNQNETE